MVTGGLESVLIGDPVDSDDDAIGSGEGVRSLGSSQQTSVIRTRGQKAEKPVLGHGRRSGEMVAGGLESVFIGDPVDGQDDAIGSGEGIRSAGNDADILGLRSDLILAAALGDFCPILSLETVETRRNQLCVII